MKHAYLIIAHNEFEVLRRLVAALDDERNDIFIHFDKKVKVLPEIETERSRLFVIKDRVDVRWGTVRQIETELRLFEAALEEGPYVFYHLISGTHFPVKPMKSIWEFYEAHGGQELMHLWDYDARDVSNKLETYHFFMDWYSSDVPFVQAAVQRFWRYNLALQRLAGVKRHRKLEFHKADNWMSLTHEAAAYLVENKNRIVRKYKMTFCADEYFVPTELFACGCRFKIVDCKNLLYARFEGANAVALKKEDVVALKNSEFLFARKFSQSEPDALKLMEEYV